MTDAVIFVRFIEPGWHCWPGAEGRRGYLADRHRHLFHVEASCVVTHDDREIEFHDLQEEARALFRGLGQDCDMGAMSCEAMARRIGEDLAGRYQRSFKITLSEDGECGAVVTVMPPGVLPAP